MNVKTFQEKKKNNTQVVYFFIRKSIKLTSLVTTQQPGFFHPTPLKKIGKKVKNHA